MNRTMVLCGAILALHLVGSRSEGEPRLLRPGLPQETGGTRPANSEPTALFPGWGPVRRGPYISVQVNVDANGHDIPGDAADEPSIAVDPNDESRMAIGWRQFSDASSGFREAGWAWSRSGGQSWIFPGVLEPGVFRSDPVLRADPDGVFYYNSLHVFGGFYCTVFRSLDGGASWNEGAFAFGGDHSWMAVGRPRGILRGNVYCTWQGSFNRSVDGGASFEKPVPVPVIPHYATLALREDEVHVAGFGLSERFWVVRSTNASDPTVTPSFDRVTPVRLGGTWPNSPGPSPNPTGVVSLVWIAADGSHGPTRGWLYVLCSVDPTGPDPCDVGFARSTDGGATWSRPLRLNLDPPDAEPWQWFGMLGCAPNGRIDVLWNDTSASGRVDVSELVYTCSFDGGSSWSPVVPVTPPWNSHLGSRPDPKIGDYYDIHSSPTAAHVAYAATFNGAEDIYYLRIGH